MRGEGKEEESCNLKVLKTGCFTVSVSSSFLYSSDFFSGEKKGNGQVYIYMGRDWEVEGKEEDCLYYFRCLRGSV